MIAAFLRRKGIMPAAATALFILLLMAYIFNARQSASARALTEEEISALAQPALCTLLAEWDDGRTAMGVGFFFTRSGRLAASRHVVDYADSVNLVCSGKTLVKAGAIHKHPVHDLAVLDTPPASAAPLKISRRDYRTLTGEKIYVVRPEIQNFSRRAAVSGKILGYHAAQRQLALFLDAPLQGGNSGSPVMLADGTVIGMIANVTLWSADIKKPGVYYAAPTAHLYEILDAQKIR